MYKYIIMGIILLNFLPAYAENYNQSRNIYRRHYHSPYHPYSAYNQLSGRNLSALEKYALKRNYSRENDISRLERLENLAFGSIQSGDINSRYKNVENAILSRPQNNYKRTLMNHLGNYFAGQATGLSPSITSNSFMPTYSNSNSYNNFNTPGMGGFYSPNFSGTRYEQYSSGIFGGGYNMLNKNFGSGSGIRILD